MGIIDKFLEEELKKTNESTENTSDENTNEGKDKEEGGDKKYMEDFMSKMSKDDMAEACAMMTKKMERMEDDEDDSEPNLDKSDENTKLTKSAKDHMINAGKAIKDILLKEGKKKDK